jgi:hypothetical protein
MVAISTLDALGVLLRARLAAPSHFHTINTRLILQTGVNLKKIKPEQNQDPALIGRVLMALSRMGVAVEGDAR